VPRRLVDAGLLAAGLLVPTLATAQEAERCLLLCAPELKLEPTLTLENLGRRAQVEVGGVVEETEREAVFELVFALDVPTTIPRLGLTLEAIVTPFQGTSDQPFTGVSAAELGRDEIRDNPVEIESELNFYLLEQEETAGWISSHFDVVDQFSPGTRPGSASVYTHKLDLEWDTALHPFTALPEGRWLRNLEAEVSLDYLATGRPRAGDVLREQRFLDDESPWSLSLVVVLPLIPLRP